MVSPDLLKCRPRLEGNIFSMNRALAERLRQKRSGLPIRDAAMQVAHVKGLPPVPKVRGGPPSLVWFHHLQELMLKPDVDIELPGTLIVPAKKGWKGSAVLYIDDRGRWTELHTSGMLAQMTGFINEKTNGPAVLTVDVRGWGDTTPAYVPYEIAGWGDRHRWMSYVSAAMGDHVLAMRIRDGLSALAWLRSRGEVDAGKIVVGGRGMGGVVALHVAAIDGKVAGVFSADGLASFELLATSPHYAWSHEDFLPDVLRHYDLPELTAGLNMPTLLVNPRGADGRSLDDKAAKSLYRPAAKRGEAFQLHSKVQGSRARGLQIDFVRRLAG